MLEMMFPVGSARYNVAQNFKRRKGPVGFSVSAPQELS